MPRFQFYAGSAMALISCLMSMAAYAQFTISGQLRPRGEWREGYGTLALKGSDDAAFISQRTRLILDFKTDQLIFHTSVQDVRIWGQDASTISSADGNRLAVHEAWAEIILSNRDDTSSKKSLFDYFAVKAGRQELVYDDERLLGNVDWTQQARRHDAIVFKAIEKGWQADIGAAFNQNTDAINYNGTYYTPANVPATIRDSKGNLTNTPTGFIPLVNSSGISDKTGSPAFTNPPGTNALNQEYKALEFLYVAKKINQTRISGLFLMDQFGKYILDSVRNISGKDTGFVYGKHFNQPGVNLRYTTGFQVTPVFGPDNCWTGNSSFYYQGGHDRDGKTLSAYMFSLKLTYNPNLLSYLIGWDYSSGNDAFSNSKNDNRFDPLYGTPHKFHGSMDYFYSVSGSPAGGLSNPYLKIKFTSPDHRFDTEIANHYFFFADNQKGTNGRAVAKYLGTEFDLTTGYRINKFTSVDLGLSYMAATSSMEYAKNIATGTARLNPMWAYLQLNIKPVF